MTNSVVKNNEYNKENSNSNTIANALQAIAVLIYGGGFIGGIAFGQVVGEYSWDTSFSFLLALPYWAAAIISGTMFLGFAEIIKLLQRLVDIEKVYSIKTSAGVIDNTSEQFSDLPSL